MKANAPEKIYLLHDDRYVDDLSIIWFEAPYATGSIEYTRTDAFIEKAAWWLLTNASDYVILHNGYDTKELVKDFVDAIKRE